MFLYIISIRKTQVLRKHMVFLTQNIVKKQQIFYIFIMIFCIRLYKISLNLIGFIIKIFNYLVIILYLDFYFYNNNLFYTKS